MPGHVIVCGLGQVGHRVVNLLVQLGERVTVVAEGSREDWLRSARQQGVQVVLGDARDAGILAQAGIDDAAALIAATDRDAINIDLALEAKQRRPDLPIVIRLFDQQLASQLESVLGVRSAFAMAALAAPTFAATASDARISSWFDVDGVSLAVGRLSMEVGSPFLGLSVSEMAARWNLAAIACTSPDGTAIPVPAEQEVQPGDTLTLVGARDAWSAALGATDHVEPVWPNWKRRGSSAARQLDPLAAIRLVWTIWRNAPIGMRAVSASFGVLVVVSLFVFKQSLGLSLVDALYFMATTLTTTGYGDITPSQGADAVKIYAALFMLAGSATLGILLSMVTDFVVTTRFEALSGHRRISIEDHVVVVGLGNVGYRTMAQLARAGERVVGVERNGDGEFVQASRALGPVVIGDARLANTLEMAGVSRARALVAVTPDDATNLTVGLAVKQGNPHVRTVVQLLEPNFARKAQGALGVDASLSAPFIAAPAFVAAALYPDVCHAFMLAFRLCALVDQSVPPEMDGLTCAQVANRDGILPLLVKRSTEQGFVPLTNDNCLAQGQRMVGLRWKEQIQLTKREL